jgi:hypothetical protein
MLRPSKHSHPDQTVLAASVVLLARLRSRRLEEFDALRGHLVKAIAGSGPLYLPALSLLFLLGLVVYRPKTDSLEYIGPNETI